MTLEHGRLVVIAAGKVTSQFGALAAGQHLGAFLAADVEVAQDLFELLRGRLRAEHGGRIERIALHDRLHALQRRLHEAVVDRLVDQSTARAGADLTLVEREHDEALDRLVEEVVVFREHILEENVG